jgi:hypothetical protein
MLIQAFVHKERKHYAAKSDFALGNFIIRGCGSDYAASPTCD